MCTKTHTHAKITGYEIILLNFFSFLHYPYVWCLDSFLLFFLTPTSLWICYELGKNTDKSLCSLTLKFPLSCHCFIFMTYPHSHNLFSHCLLKKNSWFFIMVLWFHFKENSQVAFKDISDCLLGRKEKSESYLFIVRNMLGIPSKEDAKVTKKF